MSEESVIAFIMVINILYNVKHIAEFISASSQGYVLFDFLSFIEKRHTFHNYFLLRIDNKPSTQEQIMASCKAWEYSIKYWAAETKSFW